MEKAVTSKQGPLATCQLRIQQRKQRPNYELVLDDVDVQLQHEATNLIDRFGTILYILLFMVWIFPGKKYLQHQPLGSPAHQGSQLLRLPAKVSPGAGGADPGQDQQHLHRRGQVQEYPTGRQHSGLLTTRPTTDGRKVRNLLYLGEIDLPCVESRNPRVLSQNFCVL